MKKRNEAIQDQFSRWINILLSKSDEYESSGVATHPSQPHQTSLRGIANEMKAFVAGSSIS